MRPALFLALALGACGPADPWPGAYVGDTLTEGRDCTTGERFEPAVRRVTVVVERGPSGLFVNGVCLFTLTELSARSARVEPMRCETTLDDGTPATVEIIGGRVILDGDELALDYMADLVTPDACVTASSMFVGFRE